MYPTLSISLVPFALSLLANAGFSPHLEACFTNRTLSPPNEGAKPPNPGSGITGDRLNVTRCYCEAPTFDNWGFFLQADYSNYHNGRSYTTQYACVNDTRSQPDIPKCWDAEDRFGRSTCVQDDQENQFCYETHYKKFHKKHNPAIPWDKFSFNGQARKLGTSLGAQLPSAHLEPDSCGYYCAHYVNGMNVARDSETTWVKTVHLPKKGKSGKTVQICNSKTVYDDLDDMCWNCEKFE